MDLINENKIWSGPREIPFYHETVSVGKAIYYALSRNRTVISQINDNNGMLMTSGEILDKMLKIACNLQDKGVSRDCIIALIVENDHMVAPILFAGLLLAIPLHVIEPSYTVEELEFMLKKTRPSVIFCISKVYDKVRRSTEGIFPKCRIITIDLKISEVEYVEEYLLETGRENDLEMPDVGKETIAVMYQTSGTTGPPKIACISHQRLLYRCGYPCCKELTTGFAAITFYKIYWTCGLEIFILTTLFESTRVITNDIFTPELFFQMVEKYQPNMFFLGPYKMIAILSTKHFRPEKLASITEYAFTGSAISEKLWRGMLKFFPNAKIYNSYGMTETGMIAEHLMRPNKNAAGKIASGTSVKIIDEAGQLCSSGVIGEICIKSDYTFLGYYNDPEATENIIDSEGWLHTGDLGMMDNEGDLYVIDRIKDIIDFCSENVIPLYIEKVILENSSVKFASVIGIPHPDYGEIPAAAIVLNENCSASEEEIKELVSSKLSYHNRLLGGVYFFDELPRNSNLKIKKKLIRDMILNTQNPQFIQNQLDLKNKILL